MLGLQTTSSREDTRVKRLAKAQTFSEAVYGLSRVFFILTNGWQVQVTKQLNITIPSWSLVVRMGYQDLPRSAYPPLRSL